ncbi:hypothetical protein V6Z11_A13G188800 [Gossypium hirsutum]
MPLCLTHAIAFLGTLVSDFSPLALGDLPGELTAKKEERLFSSSALTIRVGKRKKSL